jgi:hypothetical protein
MPKIESPLLQISGFRLVAGKTGVNLVEVILCREGTPLQANC